MRWRTRALSAVVLASAAVAAAGGCAGNSPIDVSPPGSPTPATLSGGVIPVLQGFPGLTCTNAACHGNPTRGSGNGYLSLAGTSSQVYAALTQMTAGDGQIVVNIANPTQSELLSKPDAAIPTPTHTGGKTFWDHTAPNAQYETVLSWIQAGAPNN